jgi:large subunit ribosomal protein L15
MLHTLQPASGSTKKRKRVARGNSAGGGTTAGRGTKGQQARTGKGRRFGFEGGQIPLIRRQPKLGGFTPPRSFEYEVLTLAALEEKLPAGSYDIAALRSHRLVHGKKPVKVLTTGSVTKKFELSVHAASKSAKAAIEKAGGKITIVKASR